MMARLYSTSALLLLLPLLSLGFSNVNPSQSILICGSNDDIVCSIRKGFQQEQEPLVHLKRSNKVKDKLLDYPDDTFSAIILDGNGGRWREKGDMIRYCTRRRLLPVRLVLLSTKGMNTRAAAKALRRRQYYYECGADAVVTSMKELKAAYRKLVYHGCTMTTTKEDTTESLLQRRWKRQAQLMDLAGGVLTNRIQQLQSYSSRLSQQLDALSNTDDEAATQHGHKSSLLRVVHISDTHNLHSYIALPDSADLLLHTGDMVGNYRTTNYEIDVLAQFQGFLEWIGREAVPKFDKIIFLAGNHDTYLDRRKMEETNQLHIYDQAMEILNTFLDDHHPTVSYLDQSSVEYRGMTIYGTPTTICRVEAQQRHMLSSAFERTAEERRNEWNDIPKCDILMTHLPPAGLGLANGDQSCPMLTDAVYSDSPFPRLHVFGHIHSQYGIIRTEENTILSNACQERLLRVDIHGGGAPIVIDLAIE